MHWIDNVEYKPKPSDDTLLLTREYHGDGTHGTLVLPSGDVFHTVERPWLDNQQGISCIPEGEYVMQLRSSGVVKRTSGGEFLRGWEITDVPGRSYIMWHPGNNPLSDSEGCVLVGSSKNFHEGVPVVWHSRKAFRELMSKLAIRDKWNIRITS